MWKMIQQEKTSKNKNMKFGDQVAIIKVLGDSMLPIIVNGSTHIIIQKQTYCLGDVIAFYYPADKTCVVHRIVECLHDSYVCKGDNSFRLELVDIHNVIGKVIGLISIDKRILSLSHDIGKLFIELKCDIEKTKQTDTYKKYYKEYLSKI